MPEKHTANRGKPKNVLRLPDLDHSKASVLQSLGSVASKRTYALAINDFIAWNCSEPRLAFGPTVVLRYRYELEARRLAPATINLRLAAVRRLAYEASDNGLLSPDLAASIRRVKGVSDSIRSAQDTAPPPEVFQEYETGQASSHAAIVPSLPEACRGLVTSRSKWSGHSRGRRAPARQRCAHYLEQRRDGFQSGHQLSSNIAAQCRIKFLEGQLPFVVAILTNNPRRFSCGLRGI